jgi:hypothetical protein
MLVTFASGTSVVVSLLTVVEIIISARRISNIPTRCDSTSTIGGPITRLVGETVAGSGKGRAVVELSVLVAYEILTEIGL